MPNLQAQNPETDTEKALRLKKEKIERDRRRVDSIRALSDYDKARSLDTMRWVFRIAPLGLVDIFNPNFKVGAEYISPKNERYSWSPEIGVGFPLGISTVNRASGRSMSLLPLNYRSFWFNNEFRMYRDKFRPSYSEDLNGTERYHAIELQTIYRTFDVEGVDTINLASNFRGNYGVKQLIFVLNFKRGKLYPYRNVYFDFYYGGGLRMVNEFHNNPMSLKEEDIYYISSFHQKGNKTGTLLALNITLGIKMMFFSF